MVQHSSPVSAHAPGPIRTCVGCRTRVLAVDLLRFVARSSGDGIAVVPDPARRLPGRGGWIHRSTECLQNAERRRAFGRALKVSGRFDLAELERELSR
ncbi:MAG: YlxR family protein [Nocardiaceae bacterium]|nr:YlxR family protein [Nocardiaceae bacterium]